MNAQDSTSTRPYLIRALHEWCTDNGLTPYIAVNVDGSVQVPREYVQDGEIVLNVSYDATSALQIGNDFIEFKARFGGKSRDIVVPTGRVIAIYARENGQGMAFPPPEELLPAANVADLSDVGSTAYEPSSSPSSQDRVVQLAATEVSAVDGEEEPLRPPTKPTGTRPVLKRIK